jgi:hypothetical protein
LKVRADVLIHTIGHTLIELACDMRVAVRSLLRVKGLAATIIVTLGLGIGANAAIFSVVRGVLLRPLVNRGEERLIYIRQIAPGVGIESFTFSMPEVSLAPAASGLHQAPIAASGSSRRR